MEKAEDTADGDEILWGAAAIATALERPIRRTYYLLERGLLPPARKIGGQWMCSSVALRSWLRDGGAGGKAA